MNQQQVMKQKKSNGNTIAIHETPKQKNDSR